MNPESLSRIDAALSSAVKELFSSHGLRLEEAHFTGQAIEKPFAATIGFTSDRLRGVLVLIASRLLAERSLPAGLRASKAEDSIIADWTGELANQVLGRLKNRFCAVGIDIALSTPTVFAGAELRHYSQHLPLSRRLIFEGDGTLLAEFQADFDSDFEIGEEETGKDAALPEGEALFF